MGLLGTLGLTQVCNFFGIHFLQKLSSGSICFLLFCLSLEFLLSKSSALLHKVLALLPAIFVKSIRSSLILILRNVALFSSYLEFLLQKICYLGKQLSINVSYELSFIAFQMMHTAPILS